MIGPLLTLEDKLEKLEYYLISEKDDLPEGFKYAELNLMFLPDLKPEFIIFFSVYSRSMCSPIKPFRLAYKRRLHDRTN